MKKGKYGEETVPVRVPRSKVEAVQVFLKRYEVIDGSLEQAIDGPNSDTEYYQGYRKGFVDGFEKGEEYQFGLSYCLMEDEEGLAVALDLFHQRVPESIHLEAMIKFAEHTMAMPLDIGSRVTKLRRLFDAIENKAPVLKLVKDNT
jgi:hypothetical protein